MRRARRLTPREINTALAVAARAGAAWVFDRHYVTGHRTIAYREPTDRTYHVSGFGSGSFASAAGVSTEVALTHLARLTADGRIIEEPRSRGTGARCFRLPREQYDALAREVITQLEAEGLPHDDDWRAARAAAAAEGQP